MQPSVFAHAGAWFESADEAGDAVGPRAEIGLALDLAVTRTTRLGARVAYDAMYSPSLGISLGSGILGVHVSADL